MNKPELITMSAKGQLVVPQDLRAEQGFGPGEMFIAFPVQDGVMFKKVDLSKEFERIAKGIRKRAKEYNVTKKDLEKAIKEVRKSSGRH